MEVSFKVPLFASSRAAEFAICPERRNCPRLWPFLPVGQILNLLRRQERQERKSIPCWGGSLLEPCRTRSVGSNSVSNVPPKLPKRLSVGSNSVCNVPPIGAGRGAGSVLSVLVPFATSHQSSQNGFLSVLIPFATSPRSVPDAMPDPFCRF